MRRGLSRFLNGSLRVPKVKTMIACAQCKTTNTLDSRFCRQCGVELAPDVLVEARAEFDALVAKGTQAFEDGRIDDAMAIAEEAVRTDPTHANAHALKGMAHERGGEIAKALEAYERVCDLNPNSALDRVKLTGLRAALAERATAAPDRRTPLLAGASAAVLLTCFGIAATKFAGGPKTDTAAPIAANTSGLVAKAEGPAADALGSDESPVTNQRIASGTNTTLGPDDVPPVGSTNTASTDGTILNGTGTPTRSGSLPRPRPDAGGGLSGQLPPMEISPALPQGAISNTLPNPNGSPSYPTNKGQKPPSRSIDPTPTPQAQDPAPMSNVPRSTPKKNDGVIDIQVEGGSGGTSAPTTGNGAEALSRVGKAHAQGGDFDRAAKAYERALASGADPAATNQRLGQAYERMGRKADAKAAYGRSADGYRKKIATGKASDRDKNGLDSVNQAMKVLDRG